MSDKRPNKHGSCEPVDGAGQSDGQGRRREPACEHAETRSELRTEKAPLGKKKDDLIEISYSVAVCTKCGATTESKKDVARKRNDAIRRSLGLLTADEVREVRHNLGVNRRKFALDTGISFMSLVRWELGLSVPNKGYDSLLRLLRYCENYHRLCSQPGDRESQPPSGQHTYDDMEKMAREDVIHAIEGLEEAAFVKLVTALFTSMGYLLKQPDPQRREAGITFAVYSATDPLGTTHAPKQMLVRGGAVIGEAEDLQGVLNEGETGLLVCKRRLQETAPTKGLPIYWPNVEILPLDELADLWTQHYDRLSSSQQEILPLRRISFLAPRTKPGA